MAIVITNGKHYIKMTDTGAVAKTDNINEARVYLTVNEAVKLMKDAPARLKKYYIFDTVTQVCYYSNSGRIKFPREVRELIYHNADGTTKQS